MLRNFLIITLRNTFRQPLYALLNLSCLTVGIASALLIVLYLDFELNYDRFHAKAKRIYRVETTSVNIKQKVLEVGWHTTPANLGALIKQDYPQVENYVRFFRFFKEEEIKFEHEGQLFGEKEVFTVDPSVFDIFSFDLVAGSPKQALDGPNKIVLSQRLARRIFGKTSPVGQILTSKLVHNLPDWGEQYSLLVTGVYRDLPKNAHLPVQAMISSQTDPGLNSYYFGTFNAFTYLLLPATTNPEGFAPKLTEIYNRYLDAAREPVMTHARHALVPLTDIHTRETGGFKYIYIFSAIGLLLMLIAVISYVNLVTAQASRRALEIGIRKVLGSHRKQIVIQFLTESLSYVLLALLLGVVLIASLVNHLNNLLGLQLQPRQLGQPLLLLSMLFIVLAIGLLGGSYPAFFLSSFEPISVMKGRLVKGAPLRSLLVAVQFAAVIFVLSSTGMIHDQLQYLRLKDLGFDKEHILRLTLSGQNELQRWPALRDRLRQSPSVTSVATGNFIPGAHNMGRGPISADGSAGREPQIVRQGRIDYDFFSTMGIPMLRGRNFSSDFPSDSSKATIVNETFIRKFGLKGTVGERIRFGDKDNPTFLEIIGVVGDFHQSTLHSPIEPQVFFLAVSSPHVVIKVGKDFRVAAKHLEKSWQQTMPNAPLDYRFLDETLQDGYKADQLRGRIFLSFSLLTLFISFLGLFGLASYLSRQRTKEVGIRKVFGASIGNLVLLMTKDFLLLVAIAALPAFVGAWYIIGKWLENFAYRTEMNYLLFSLVLIFTLLLTFVTTGLHAFRTARLNPASTLKHE
ncbi:MAG: ABC transporter permease [Ferruginibacter sp.]|nr:ABC transporter permease [Cytophagales bacterium]